MIDLTAADKIARMKKQVGDALATDKRAELAGSRHAAVTADGRLNRAARRRAEAIGRKSARAEKRAQELGRVVEFGPSLGTFRDLSIPAFLLTAAGERFEFAREGVLDPAGGFAMSQLVEGERMIAPGLIYRRTSEAAP